MLEVLDSEYVKLARIKGVPEWKVIWKHALRNAAIAPLTYFGRVASSLLTGRVVTETVFSIPGVGRLFVDSITLHDFPVMLAIGAIILVGVVVMNLLADLLYTVVNPQIRYE